MTGFPFQIVGFDLDGTLVDTQGDLGVAVNYALGLIGREPVPPESVQSLIGGGSRLMLRRALERTGGELPDAEFVPLYADLIAHYAAHIAVHSRPYPGCLKALDDLAKKGCALAVVTNKPEALSVTLLEELGMLDLFACVIGGDTLPKAKPEPDTIFEAIKRCGGGRFVMVGDSSFDIRAARAAEVPNVALSFGYHDIPVPELGADVVIDHYDQLVDALRGL